MQVCRTVSIMAWGHHNFILNGYLCVSLSDDRTGLFLYFSNMLVSPAPSLSWCHGVNGQDDSRFTRDYYPKMKGEEYTSPDMTPALCLYCVHRGQWWRGLCSMWSPRDPGIRGSIILWLHHLEHTAPSDISQQGKRAHEYLTPVLVCFSLSHLFIRSGLLVKYRVDSSYYMWNTIISSSRPPPGDLCLLLWDNSIPFKQSIELKPISGWFTIVLTLGVNVVCLGLETLI